MTKLLPLFYDLLWGAPALALILGVGLYLSVRLGFVQITLLPRAIRAFAGMLRGGGREEGVSSFRALCTALAATVGTGNLVGVAGAICLGGPGAVFWMWISALLGMAIKYAEVVLALRYRQPDGADWIGGPMYVMTKGLGERFRPMAKLYSLFGLIAAFGVGNAAQINSAVSGLNGILALFGHNRSLPGDLLMGAALGGMLWLLLLGGAKRIGQTAEQLIPFGALAYILLCAGVLIVRFRYIPGAFAAIFEGAFSPRSVTGGLIGSSFRVLRVGCSRGVFSNEAGMGTASIAHAGAQVNHPGEQGLMGIVEVFIDTLVICTMTALVILVSGAKIPYGTDIGAELTELAFSAVYGGFSRLILGCMLTLFAVATVLGWGLYGARCSEFLFGRKAWKRFAMLQALMAVASAVLNAGTVWKLCELVNGLMVLPNLVSLALLSNQTVGLTEEYKTIIQKESGIADADGGTYADIHQCQSL